MAYFGGGGVSGPLHPSLRAYIDCWDSAPWVKSWPRGGGIWDQDPVLVRDFRVIRNFELEWKRTQEALRDVNPEAGTDPGEGENGQLENALDDYIQQLEDAL